MNEIYIVANFGEIFLKGKNIRDFEKRLFKNYKENLGKFSEKVEFTRKSGGSF
jgi:adenylyl- and sulfurtransferase ThiI